MQKSKWQSSFLGSREECRVPLRLGRAPRYKLAIASSTCYLFLLPLPVTSSCYLFEPQAERHNELKLPLKLNKEDWAERERERSRWQLVSQD